MMFDNSSFNLSLFGSTFQHFREVLLWTSKPFFLNTREFHEIRVAGRQGNSVELNPYVFFFNLNKISQILHNS